MMEKMDGQIFKKVGGKTVGKIGKGVFKNVNPFVVLEEYFEYKKTKEQNETIREAILSKRDMVIKTIESQKEIILVPLSLKENLYFFLTPTPFWKKIH